MVDTCIFKKKDESRIEILFSGCSTKLINEVLDFIDVSLNIVKPSMFEELSQSVKVFDRRTSQLPIGLWYKVYQMLNKRFSIEIVIDEGINLYSEIDETEIESFIIKLNLPDWIELRQYQKESIIHYATHKRFTFLSATSTGKSLMTYLMLCYGFKNFNHKRVLIIVPRIGLTEQLYSDFVGFDNNNGHFSFSVLNKQKIVTDDVTITTWQSLGNVNASWFNQFDCVVVDECQHSDGKVLQRIVGSCVNAKYRVGLSGSLKCADTDVLIEGLFGYSVQGLTAKEGQEMGYLTPLELNAVLMNYSQDDKLRYKALMKTVESKQRYQTEIEFIIGNQARSAFIIDYVSKLNGNVLILYDRVESHLLEEARKFSLLNSKQNHIISGDVDIDERVEIKTLLETSDNNILHASFGTFQMGESVRNLHHLVFAHSSKSRVRILQSIGRMMRKHDSKELSVIHDMVDVIGDELNPNYVLEHTIPRFANYAKEKYSLKYKIVEL
jgi:superfamily II DNA or RNA helicase